MLLVLRVWSWPWTPDSESLHHRWVAGLKLLHLVFTCSSPQHAVQEGAKMCVSHPSNYSNERFQDWVQTPSLVALKELFPVHQAAAKVFSPLTIWQVLTSKFINHKTEAAGNEGICLWLLASTCWKSYSKLGLLIPPSCIFNCIYSLITIVSITL